MIIARKLDLTFTLIGNATFAGTTANTVKLTGRRASATVTKSGGTSMGDLQLRVFGMTLSQMNQLSTLGKAPGQYSPNVVTVEAGDDSSGMATVFQGNITNAWTDFTGSPDVAFQVSAFSAAIASIESTSPSSYKGTADVATIMSDIATRCNFAFENNGVSVKLSNVYLPGSLRDQMISAAKQANIEFTVDNNVLAIWPKGGTRGSLIPLISANTGMVGYPTFNPIGVVIKTLFNPGITHKGKVKIQSIVKPACGEWEVNNLTHTLEAETIGGQWFSEIECTPVGFLP